ncbi:MAG: tetratricopeptide repeat protein [Dehalococcoidia bacterium]
MPVALAPEGRPPEAAERPEQGLGSDVLAPPAYASGDKNLLSENEERHEPEGVVDQPVDVIGEQIPLDWTAPDDDVSEVQKAVTLFERVMVAFVKRQLQALHGSSSWLKRGCSPYLKQWRERVAGNATVPDSLLGAAELGDLKQLIVSTENWPAFQTYFLKKQKVQDAFDRIISTRKGGAHPGDRKVFLTKEVNALGDMVDLTDKFHADTAQAIDELYRSRSPGAETEIPAKKRVITNLGDFADPNLVGREEELKELRSFWVDAYATRLSITGEGGVGKTALLEAFTCQLVGGAIDPEPDIVLFLTAKEEYLPYMKPAAESKKFRTLRAVQEKALALWEDSPDRIRSLEELRSELLKLCQVFRVFFALDNLETLRPEEDEALAEFLADIPPPSKAIVTSRIKPGVGRDLRLRGLPPKEAKELLSGRLSELEFPLEVEDEPAVDEIVAYSDGLPATLIHCAQAIANGFTVAETLEKLKGAEFLDILRFSFESSIERIKADHDALKLLLAVALSKVAITRSKLSAYAVDDEALTGTLLKLKDLNLIRPTAEERQTKFVISSPPLRDYAKKRASDLLAANDYAEVLRRSRISAADAASPSIVIEVERALEKAENAARSGWAKGAAELEAAMRSLGDSPQLMSKLGYYYFRLERRSEARSLLEKALAAGFETAENHTYLALALYYDRQFERGQQHAEAAITLHPRHKMAEQIAGQCLFSKAKRDALIAPEATRHEWLGKALDYLNRSIYPDESMSWHVDHNQRSRRLIEQIEPMLS